MKKAFIYTLFLVFVIVSVDAQVIYQSIESYKLGESRELKIQLPRGYSSNEAKSYPVIVVLDGDYMFEVVAGNVDYYSYWEDMPEVIVVGVNQFEKRFDDCLYSEQNSLPVETGASFFEFIGMELIPYLEKTYRTVNFRTIVGHGETANFINYYLLKQQPLFQAYMVISPELAPNMIDYIPERLAKLESKTFYYLANTSNDTNSIKSMTQALNTDLSTIESKNLLYSFDSFDGPSHYSVPAHAVPKAIESVFYVFQPISKKEYSDVLLKLETPIHLYLEEKYKTIEDLFGLTNPIRVNDFIATSRAAEKKKQWDSLREIATLAKRQYPDSVLGDYFLGRYYEETGDPKKAMRTFQAAFDKEEVDFITIDLMLEKADKIKEDFGY